MTERDRNTIAQTAIEQAKQERAANEAINLAGIASQIFAPETLRQVCQNVSSADLQPADTKVQYLATITQEDRHGSNLKTSRTATVTVDKSDTYTETTSAITKALILTRSDDGNITQITLTRI